MASRYTYVICLCHTSTDYPSNQSINNQYWPCWYHTVPYCTVPDCTVPYCNSTVTWSALRLLLPLPAWSPTLAFFLTLQTSSWASLSLLCFCFIYPSHPLCCSLFLFFLSFLSFLSVPFLSSHLTSFSISSISVSVSSSLSHPTFFVSFLLISLFSSFF